MEISEKFQEYDSRAEEIKQLPDKHNIGAIQILMGNIRLFINVVFNISCSLDEFKLALLVESDAWKHIMGKKLDSRYRDKLNTMVDFIKTQEKILNKPITELDDCRYVI